MSDNKSKRDWVWIPFIAFFVVVEGIAIFTKEKAWPTFSRTFWRATNWRVVIKLEIPITISFYPLRILTGAVIIWLFFHLSFGECAFNLC